MAKSVTKEVMEMTLSLRRVNINWERFLVAPFSFRQGEEKILVNNLLISKITTTFVTTVKFTAVIKLEHYEILQQRTRDCETPRGARVVLQ